MSASVDLLLPVGPEPFALEEKGRVRTVVDEGLADGLWVRDLPCVPAGDPDVGQGDDPLAHLALLVGQGLDRRVGRLGTASVVLGLRHPLVLARAVAGLQAQSRCPVVLGVGTGGKAAMNEVLGVAGRSMDAFATQWRELREAVHGRLGGPATSFVVPDGYQPPEMHLATSDVARWEAIEGQAEGWQTFLTTPEHYLAAREQVLAVQGGPLRVCVRVDVTLTESATAAPEVAERGRVACGARQLVALLRTWRQLPLDHLLLSVRGADPLEVLREVHEAV